LLRGRGYETRVYDSGAEFLDTNPVDGCVVLKMHMPGMNGLEVHGRMIARGITLPVIFLNGDVPLAVRAMQQGAVDFIAMSYTPDELVHAIERAFMLADNDQEIRHIRAAAIARLSALTPRGVQVLQGLRAGMANKMIARWLDRYGFDAAERWVQFNNTTPPLTLRVNRLRLTREEARRALAADGVETEPVRHAPDGLVVASGNPLRRPADGTVFVQDEASQLVSLVVDARPGSLVLDLCASPGGKTIAMAADLGSTGTIVATDVRAKRLALLRETIGSSGATNVAIVRVAAPYQLLHPQYFLGGLFHEGSLAFENIAAYSSLAEPLAKSK